MIKILTEDLQKEMQENDKQTKTRPKNSGSAQQN